MKAHSPLTEKTQIYKKLLVGSWVSCTELAPVPKFGTPVTQRSSSAKLLPEDAFFPAASSLQKTLEKILYLMYSSYEHSI